MIHFIVPIALIAAYFIWENAVAKPQKAKKKSMFQSQISELRDEINRCSSLTEWSILDQEIDWLENTWRNIIEPGVLNDQTGKLYSKWLDKGMELRKSQTPKFAS